MSPACKMNLDITMSIDRTTKTCPFPEWEVSKRKYWNRDLHRNDGWVLRHRDRSYTIACHHRDRNYTIVCHHRDIDLWPDLDVVVAVVTRDRGTERCKWSILEIVLSRKPKRKINKSQTRQTKSGRSFRVNCSILLTRPNQGVINSFYSKIISPRGDLKLPVTLISNLSLECP